MKLTIKIMILLSILALVGTDITVTTLKTSAGIDFYQFWGVSHAQKLSKGGLGSPYHEMTNYAAVLDRYSAGSDDLRLKAANRANHRLYPVGLDLIGTPLLFALYGFFSEDYSQAYVIFHTIQSILFGSSILLLFLYRKSKWLWFIGLSLITPLYSPLLSNIRVGNMNSFQLFMLIVIVLLFDKVVKKSSGRKAYIYGSVHISFLFFLIMLKPNILIVAVLLSVSLLATQGFKIYISSVIAGLFSGITLICLSSLYFKSWLVWTEWYHCLSDGSYKLFYPVQNGNYSTACIISETFNLNKNASVILISMALVFHGSVILLRCFATKNIPATGRIYWAFLGARTSCPYSSDCSA